jgi:hypothetical protein
VGSAYLFKKPQSRVRKMLRFLDVTKDDNRDCDNDTLRGSGTYNTNNAYCKLNNSNEVCYRLNTSRRRQLHSSSAQLVQGYIEIIRLVKGPTND